MIVVILMVVMAVLRVEVMIRKNLYMCMLGGGICNVGSGGDVRSGCCGSSLVHHHNHHHHHHHHHTLPFDF